MSSEWNKKNLSHTHSRILEWVEIERHDEITALKRNVCWIRWKMLNRCTCVARERANKCYENAYIFSFYISIWICTQNVRMIYFHIWFVCVFTPNVIHIKWKFLYTVTHQAQFGSPVIFFFCLSFDEPQWNRLQFFRYRILIQCVFFSPYNSYPCSSFFFLCFCFATPQNSFIAKHMICRTTNIRQNRICRYFSIYLQLHTTTYSLVMF